MVVPKGKYLAGWVIDGSGRPTEKNMLITVAGGKIRSLCQADGAENHGACQRKSVF